MTSETVAGLFAVLAVALSAILLRGSADTHFRKRLTEDMDLLERLPADSPHRHAMELRVEEMLHMYAPTVDGTPEFNFVRWMNVAGILGGVIIAVFGVWLLFGGHALAQILKGSVLAIGVMIAISAGRTMVIQGPPMTRPDRAKPVDDAASTSESD
jgi:hypothetical protein